MLILHELGSIGLLAYEEIGMMRLCYELRGNPAILHAITIAILLFLCWMTRRVVLMREALGMDFMRALYL
jgi:hypothetical protein